MMKHYPLNVAGRDFVVGDIHGCFTKLKSELRDIAFNESIDRLFSVGDLVDRGTESEQSLEWLDKPWFHAVRGNHEQLAIDAEKGFYDPGHYTANGGAWFISLTPPERLKFADAFIALPIALDVETSAGLIGIVHAECPVSDWGDMAARLDDGHAGQFAQACVWSRDRATNKDTSVVAGVKHVIVGHTPMQRPIQLGNVIYIDTGAVFGRELTIIQIQ